MNNLITREELVRLAQKAIKAWNGPYPNRKLPAKKLPARMTDKELMDWLWDSTDMRSSRYTTSELLIELEKRFLTKNNNETTRIRRTPRSRTLPKG